MKIIFEPMNEANIAEIALIEKECFTVPWSDNSLKEELSNSYARFYVAKIENKIVGYIGSHNILGEVYITNVAVLKKYRLLGIGTALLKHLINVSESEKADFITLEVRKSNQNAINLYSKLDFKNVGIRKNFYENPKEDALLMTLYLDGVK